MNAEKLLQQFERRILLFSVFPAYLSAIFTIATILRGGHAWPGYINIVGLLLVWWIYRNCRYSIINHEIRRLFLST